MGGTCLRDESRWQAALATGADIAIVAASFHAVGPRYGHQARQLDQHICNLILSGSMVAIVGGHRRLLGPGTALWMNPDVIHDFALGQAGRGFTMLNLRFRLQRGGRPLGFARDLMVVDNCWDLRPLWELIIDDAQRQGDGSERFRHCLALLYSDLTRREKTGDEPSDGLGRHRRLALLAWISTRHHLRPSTAQLARVVGLSSDWFRRAFQRSFHCSPRTWLVQQRIRRAARELGEHPDLGIQDLAERYGYEDYRLFDRQFRQVMGRSPRRWLMA